MRLENNADFVLRFYIGNICGDFFADCLDYSLGQSGFVA